MANEKSSSPADQVQVLPEARKRVIIQRNPVSGSGSGRKQLLILVRQLKLAGFQVRMFSNRDHLDAYVRLPQVIDQVRCLVAAGGDGTVGNLAHRHPNLPIATLPLGTENLLARYLQVPRCGSTVADVIARGRVRCFDTGAVNGQTFLLMVSVGVDAEVVRRLTEVRTGNIRHMSYLRPIANSFLRYQFPQLSVYAEDGSLLATGTHVIATNIPEYGFRMQFSPDANPQDGRLDVRVFRRTGRLATIWHAIRTRLGLKDRANEVHRFQENKFEIRSDAEFTAAQCDGDPAANCPIKVETSPNSMILVVRD